MRWLEHSALRSRTAVVIAALTLVAALVPVVPVAAVEPSDPTIIYVDNSVDGPGTGAADDPYKLLTDALATVAAGDTIMVAAGTYGPATDEVLPFVVPSDVTIIGEYSEEDGWLTILSGDMITEDLGAASSPPSIMELGEDPMVGAIVVPEPEPVSGVVLANLEFANNYTDDRSAGINMYLAEVDITNCAFTALSSFSGSAIYAIESTVTISWSAFVGNGGGIPAPFSMDAQGATLERYGIDAAELRLDKLTDADEIGAEQAPLEAMYGGAISAAVTDLNVDDCVFVGNQAAIGGGAILTYGAPTSTRDSLFLGNYAGSLETDSVVPPSFDGAEEWMTALVDPYMSPAGGGAVCSVAANYSDDASYFVMNEADPGAAVVSFVGAVTMRRSLIGGNYGASVVAFGQELAAGSTAMADVVGEIEPPMPEGEWSGLDIDRAAFYENYGIFTTYSSTFPTRISNSAYVGNDALSVVNLAGIITEESAEIMPVPEPEPFVSSVEGCTFTENSAGLAMVTGPREAPTTLVNTIIWGNDPADINAMAEYDAAGVDAYNVDYENEIAARVEQDCFSEDPLFADPDDFDFSLSPGSPCIDTGVSVPEAPDFTATEAALEWDLRPWDFLNVTRPIDGDDDGEALFDVGAYEYLPSGRSAGEDRYATAVKISSQHFGQSDVVVIATGRVFADGLSGSGLAGLYDAPILLVQPDSLPPNVADEIVRLGASKVFILGGPVAVGTEVEDALLGMGLDVTRIGGADRYETSALIAEHIVGSRTEGFMFRPLDMTFIARGDLFADALAVSPVAYANVAPVLLVQPDELPEHVVDVITDLGVTSAVVLGGDVAVDDMVAAEVGALAEEVTRIEGADRYETAANIAEWAWENGLAGFGLTGVATGEDFADALSGGPGIGALYGVLLLNPSASVHEACESAITTHAPEIGSLRILGGPAAISEDVYDELMGLLAP